MIYLLLKIFSLFLLVLNHSGVLNFVLEILEMLFLMMLIYLNASVLVMNLKKSIKVFGLNLLNMILLTNLYKLSSLKEQKSKILILFLVTYISLFLTLVMENLDKSPVKPKLNLLPRKKWKMKIYLLMMFLSVLN